MGIRWRCCAVRSNSSSNSAINSVTSAQRRLRAFVARSEGCIRTASDWIARVGLGEVMIVLPETGGQGAECVARKLHEVAGAESVATPMGPVTLKLEITLIAAAPNKGSDSALPIEELIPTARRRIVRRGNLGIKIN